MTSVISTSWMEARIVVVRSTMTLRWSEGEMEARSSGKRARDAIDGFDHVRAGLAENGEEDGGLAAGQTQVADVLDGIDDFRDVAQAHRSAGMSSNDQRLIFVGLEELVGVGDRPRFAGDRRASLWRDWRWPTAERVRTVSRLMP